MSIFFQLLLVIMADTIFIETIIVNHPATRIFALFNLGALENIILS